MYFKAHKKRSFIDLPNPELDCLIFNNAIVQYHTKTYHFF